MKSGAWVWALFVGLAVAACGSDSNNSGSNEPPSPESGTAGKGDKPSPETEGGAGGQTPEPSSGSAGAPEGGGGGTEPAVEDPCAGIPLAGLCMGDFEARVCVVPTGNGTPTVVSRVCRSFEHCAIEGGPARCVLNDSACIPGQAECTGASQVRVCNDNGAWATQTCPGACQSSALGGFCGASGATELFQGTLEYEVVVPNDDISDWSRTTEFLPASDALVLSGDGTDWFDAVLVEADGSFSVRVPVAKTGAEVLAILLLHPDPSGATAQFGVFLPDVPDGDVSVDAGLEGQVWSWLYALSDATNGGTIQIDTASGSGAMHVYNRIAKVHGATTEFYGETPGTLAAWFRPNTAWDCGACFAEAPTEIAALPFDSQMFISATAENQEYWSDAVLAHEIGHYTMWSFGAAVAEGGRHCLGVPTAPGMAWSEGWATGFSSIVRGTPIYYDKQQGSMFWIDLSSRTSSWPWQRPDPGASLLQDIDENEVAAMIWSLAENDEVGADAVLAGLKSRNVTVPQFKRGYTRQLWDRGRDCERVGILDTGESAPTFADYLDGLACAGVPAAAIDASTQPKQAYPYPSSAPLCR